MQEVLRVGIIGGGVGGLVIANFLTRLGHRVQVFEKAQRFIPTVGAGFTLSPNGQRVFQQLGFHEELQELLHPYHCIHSKKPNGTTIGMTEVDGFKQATGYFLGGCRRAQVIDLLVRKLPKDTISYGKTFKFLEDFDDHVQLTVNNQDGQQDTHELDVLIGADGIRSKVQHFVLAPDNVRPPRFTGYQIFYGTIHEPDAELTVEEKKQLSGISSTTFPYHHVVQMMGGGHYFLTFNVGGQESSEPSRCWAFLTRGSEKGLKESWLEQGNKKKLLSFNGLDEFEPSVRRLMELTPANHVLHFGLYDRDPIDKWYKGNHLVLLGDAAHAMLPNAGGQGANMALEDAYVLASVMQKYPVTQLEKAFEEYQSIRWRRTASLIQIGQRAAKLEMTQSSIIEWLRNQIFGRMMSSGFLAKAMIKEVVGKSPVPITPTFPFSSMRND